MGCPESHGSFGGNVLLLIMAFMNPKSMNFSVPKISGLYERTIAHITNATANSSSTTATYRTNQEARNSTCNSVSSALPLLQRSQNENAASASAQNMTSPRPNDASCIMARV